MTATFWMCTNPTNGQFTQWIKPISISKLSTRYNVNQTYFVTRSKNMKKYEWLTPTTTSMTLWVSLENHSPYWLRQREELPGWLTPSGDLECSERRGYYIPDQQLRTWVAYHCQHLPQPVADRDVLQMDQGKPDGQSPLVILWERCQNPSLGRNQFVLVARLDESRAQKHADYHGSIKSGWTIAPYQEGSPTTAECSRLAHSKSECQWTWIILLYQNLSHQ